MLRFIMKVGRIVEFGLCGRAVWITGQLKMTENFALIYRLLPETYVYTTTLN
jgi:hypothetical protein